MKVVFSAAATADLHEIGDYIAADNPNRAVTFVQELIDSAADLADQPRAFPVIPRYVRFNIRRRPHGNYLIFYTVDGDSSIRSMATA